jgi:hypothetical protein
VFVSNESQTRSNPATPTEGDRAGRWSVIRVPPTVTTDTSATEQVLDTAQTDGVPTSYLMLGRTGQKLGNDGLDIRLTEPAVERPRLVLLWCRTASWWLSVFVVSPQVVDERGVQP